MVGKQTKEGAIAAAAMMVSELAERWNSDNPPVGAMGYPTAPLAQTRYGPPSPSGLVNPYWDIVRMLPRDFFEVSRLGGTARDEWINDLPAPAHSRAALVRLFAFAILELGAGTGYWAWQLSQAGIDVVAYDTHQWATDQWLPQIKYHPVYTGSIEQIPRHPTRALMLCWPDRTTSFASDALAAYSGDTFIYIGEPGYGCTGDAAFATMLDEQWELVALSPAHINYLGIQSHVGAYRRSAKQDPKRGSAMRRATATARCGPEYVSGAYHSSAPL